MKYLILLADRKSLNVLVFLFYVLHNFFFSG